MKSIYIFPGRYSYALLGGFFPLTFWCDYPFKTPGSQGELTRSSPFGRTGLKILLLIHSQTFASEYLLQKFERKAEIFGNESAGFNKNSLLPKGCRKSLASTGAIVLFASL
jgi:hypothetical protein